MQVQPSGDQSVPAGRGGAASLFPGRDKLGKTTPCVVTPGKVLQVPSLGARQFRVQSRLLKQPALPSEAQPSSGSLQEFQ